MATLIPFPAPPATTEDALAYWTPPRPTVPERAAAPFDKRLAALEQMYGYYAAN